MVRLTRIYTKTGDMGLTGLSGPARRSKADPRIEVIGDVDEANSSLGWVRQFLQPEIDEILVQVQHDLFDVGADLAVVEFDKVALRVTSHQVDKLEQYIDHFNVLLAPLTSFVLPGGSKAASAFHCARTVVRRAERGVVRLQALEVVNPEILKYLNRLSDLLFVLARVHNNYGKEDVLWIPGKNIKQEAVD